MFKLLNLFTNPHFKIINSLLFRLVFSILTVMLLMGMVLYFFNLRIISETALLNTQNEFNRISKEIYKSCDSVLTELLYEGSIEDHKVVSIKQVQTITQIESIIRSNSFSALLIDSQKGILLDVNLSSDFALALPQTLKPNELHTISFAGRDYYVYKFAFDPWQWEFVVTKSVVDVLTLPKVKLSYIITICSLLFTMVILLYIIRRYVKEPIETIIDSIKNNTCPRYKGINEFEFLALSITEMMKENRTYVATLEQYTKELQELNRTLEARVAQAVAESRQKDHILIHQSRLAAMGEMIGAIAHQWRQPLNALAIVIQDIKDAHSFGELDKVYLDTSVQNALKHINFMSKTIDDFRNFFRMDKETSTFDVKLAVADVIAMLSAQLKASNIFYRLTCHEHNRCFEDFSEVHSCEAFSITSYQNELKQVFLNIICNAKDAIAEAKAKGKLHEQGLIAIDFYKSPSSVIITITDNAGGIPEDIITRIFEPYFTTKEQGKGTGIGLYMSKMIIEKNMGGRLIASNTETGAQFKIEVPIQIKSSCEGET